MSEQTEIEKLQKEREINAGRIFNEIKLLLQDMYEIDDCAINLLMDASIKSAVKNHPDYSNVGIIEHSNLCFLFNLRQGTIRDWIAGSQINVNKTLENVV